MLSNNMAQGFHCDYRIEDISNHLAAVFDLVEHYRREFELKELVVRYETLIADPAGHTRKLLDYLGLPFEKACLQKLHQDSINRYKHYEQHLRPCATRLEPLMKGHDYKP
jgi:hypothetical protein